MPDTLSDDGQADDLPDYTPVTPPRSGDAETEPAAEAATESGGANPVFGSDVQPQEIFDPEVVGTDDITGLPGADNTPAANFDPEKDPRMQEPPEEA